MITHHVTLRMLGHMRVNLGCIDEVDNSNLEMLIFDGKNLLESPILLLGANSEIRKAKEAKYSGHYGGSAHGSSTWLLREPKRKKPKH